MSFVIKNFNCRVNNKSNGKNLIKKKCIRLCRIFPFCSFALMAVKLWLSYKSLVMTYILMPFIPIYFYFFLLLRLSINKQTATRLRHFKTITQAMERYYIIENTPRGADLIIFISTLPEDSSTLNFSLGLQKSRKNK